MWTHNQGNKVEFKPTSKSRHLNQVVTSEERLRFEREDAECLSSIVFVAPRVVPAARSKNAVFEDSFEKITAVYRITDDVKPFLSDHEYLMQPLLQAIEPIKFAFGSAEDIELRVLKDGTSEQLFAVIPTKLKPETAIRRLRAFDENWWFSAPNEIRDVLEFTLEFV